MIKYILFDFDGTLADSTHVFIAAWNTLADKHQYRKIKREEMNFLRKLSIPERIKYLKFPIIRAPLIFTDFYRYYRKYAKEINLYPGMKELLVTLEKQGHKIAIISSNSEDVIKEVLRKNRVNNILQIMCSQVIFGKDQLIRKFLKEKRLASSEVIYVGDEQRDVMACKAAGIKIIWVSWGYDAKELLQEQKPDYFVDCPEEIVEIVSRTHET